MMLLSSFDQAMGQQTTAITSGTVLTMAGAAIEKGTVLIRDGKILEVGAGVRIPADATVIDADGKYIMPGVVDAMTYFGLRPTDRNDTSRPVTPENRIINAFAPFSDFMGGRGATDRRRELLSGGITTIYIAPGNRQVVGGQGAVVKTYGGGSHPVILREPASIDMTLGDPPKRVFGEKRKSPSTRMSVAAHIRKALMGARDYQQAQARQKKKTGEEAASDKPPQRDLANEALIKLLQKEVPARIEANHTDDIRTAIRLAEEFDIDIVIDGGIGAYDLKDLLAVKGIPVILGPVSHNFMTEIAGGRTLELFTKVNEYNAALLVDAGVKIAFASYGYSAGYTGSSHQGRWLLLEAGLATGFGLPDAAALKAVTINAAEILGIEDRVGSIEKGKDADLIILNGPPLDPKTWVERVYINGAQVYQLPEQSDR
jgi:imidazolonepropionase-like amidohydrolase